jgi:gamma-glutamylcyclotransferase (GGCT)/AIG2-like uncharacterized protein YtfP
MGNDKHTELLFSYGTLQFERVQMATFGRPLAGTARHTMATFTGHASDVVSGTVFAVTADELQSADTYEVAAVTRVAVVLQSGARAWAYVDARRVPAAQ